MHRFIQATKRIQLIEKSSIFCDLIVQSIHDEPNQRPTAAELEDTLNKYRRAADNYINEKYPDYTGQTLTMKNDMFLKFYDSYHKLQKEEPKPIYSLPPKPHFNSDLFRQYFDDMMKQFNSFFHRINSWRSKKLQPLPHITKIMKYFDNKTTNDQQSIIKLEPIELDKRPARHLTPPSDFLRIQEETQPPFLNVVRHPRSRTPTPHSPHFGNQEHRRHFSPQLDPFQPFIADNNIKQRHRKFHVDDDFDRNFPQCHHVVPKFK